MLSKLRNIQRAAAGAIALTGLVLVLGACQTTADQSDPKRKAQEEQLLRDAYHSYRNQ